MRQSIVEEINLGKTTVPEPGLNELVSNNVRVGRLRATTDFEAIADNDFVVVTVGTPLGPDFEPIIDDIKAAARAVGEHLPRRIPDSTKAQRKLGWRLHVDVEEGLPSHHRLGAGQPVVPSERLGLRR
ncbi:MAG: hypothetical protein WBM01_25200 [Mycobacterium sp.]|uniref:hypothetical protein n=1 Tax=Mycobacterium sp. TaxID=1785 RepID=UPI003C708775